MRNQVKTNRRALWAIAIGLVVLVVYVIGWSGRSTGRGVARYAPTPAEDDFFVDETPSASGQRKKELVVFEAMVDVMVDAALKENPTLRENLPQVREEFRKGLIAQEMMVAEAIDMGLAASDPIARNRLSELIMLSIYQQADTGLNPQAVRSFYESNRHKYILPEKRHVQHLFVRVTNVTDDEMAQRTLGEKFSEAAGPQSGQSDALKRAIEPRRVTREEVRLRFGPSFSEWLFSIEVGEWSDPKRSTSGWHRVRILEESPERLRDFEEVEAEVEADLRQTLRLRAYENEMERLSRKYKVIIE